ncbi:sugar-binding protein [Micromonospora terminaliae]|uniref:RHS repeat-associated core domain-containing protein n=2 Tax=Micromonospora terminaliae TaxID=1914461 RepID=A0AAJ3DLC4_9ACTN|nr:RHS repeat-associated core domain-containing protein [Micromonospora terminaliae]QGL47231.1 sugar-binding protein [Micromonospora terminaliae]
MTVPSLQRGQARKRLRRALALGVTMTCVIVGTWVPAYAAPQQPAKPPKPYPGRAVSGVKPVPSHFVTPPNAAKSNHKPTATRWPAAAKASVTLPTSSDAATATARAKGTPVWLRPTATGGRYAGPPKADVRVLDQATAQRAGIVGLLVAVYPQGQGTGHARVGVDYAGFAEAYGGNYGSRLRLVQLPECALTTPEVSACRTATLVKSTNDAAARTVSAEITLAGGTSSDRAASASAPTVLAAVATSDTTASGAGTYAASDLKPSGSWSGGGSSGAFTYSYPLTVPPAATGLTPTLTLSYDSSSVDGQTASTQAQASWAGDGWSTAQSYVEQSFISCADDPEGTASPKKTSDLCYDGPILTLSLNGSTSALVWDAGKQVWKPTSDNGEVITHVMNSNNGSGTRDTDYWRLTARDGTVYEFGRNQLPGWTSGKPTTKSVDTVPVYSPHSSGPCYNSAGFDSSVCTMARRWNLDYVKDVHGTAMAYYYKQATNYYGRNQGATMASYVRDSYLDRIDYGFTDGNAYGPVPNQVVFGTGDRCLSGTCQPLNAANKANWPDVPYDLVCDSGATCTSQSPSFFSTVRLTSITTQQSNTGSAPYTPVDLWALTHTMPTTEDGTSPTLWLDSITRTGYDTPPGGTTVSKTLPSVSFGSIKLQNRVATVDGFPVFNRHRLETITTETGSVITVSYERPDPCTAPVTVDPATNTTSCYPIRWTPDGLTAPILDWFNKYAVTRVSATDPTGGSGGTFTSYAYLGGAAWHYDDNELVKAKHRTYGQFRGYRTVQTFTGDGDFDRRTKSTAAYYRGMSRNNGGAVVNLTDSTGGTHEDLNELAGQPLETTQHKGEGGPVDNSTITAYWVSAPTATRARTGLPDLTANWVAPALVQNRQAVTSGGSTTWRVNQTDTSYDATVSSPTLGLAKATYSHAVPADPAYDSCTTTNYAPVNASKNLVGLVSETETVSVACAGYTPGSPASEPGSLNTLTTPTTVSRPAQVVGRTRTFYDDATWSTTFPQAAPPSKGDVTMTRKAADYTSGAYTWQTMSRASYDSYGRARDTYDGNGNKTTTTYTDNAVGLTTATTVANALGHTQSTTIDPQRGLPLAATDPNGVVTTQQYDPLGRATAVWLNNRATSAPANYKFTYAVSKTGITATTTEWANDFNGYIKSTIIYDAQLRPRQTQTDTPQGGRLVTDTFYDSRGWIDATYNGWWDSATTPNTTLATATKLPSSVPSQTFTTYDGLGRPVVVEQAKDGLTVSKTTTVYNGDRTTVIPPAGGTVSTTITDPIGRTSQLLQYSSRPTLNTPADTFTGTFTTTGGTTIASTYHYDEHGNQDAVADADGNTWTSQYNLLGQVTSKTDPDAGKTTGMTYDGSGNLTQSTDSRGKTVSSTYDALNRKIASYAAATTAQSPSNQLTALVYDNSNNAVLNMTNPKGHLTTSTAYWNNQPYKTQVKGFNVFGKPTGETISIPTVEGPLGGDYIFNYVYTPNNGLPLKTSYPLKGGLPAETTLYGYDAFDQVDHFGGLNGYLQGVTQDAYGRINQQTIGSSPNQAFITNTYDEHTGRLKQQLVTRTPTTPDNVDQQNYDYDLAGNVIHHTSTRLGGASSETQCYTYDQLRRLTEAWTATDDCTTTPTIANHAMVGNTIGGNSAYWTSWTFDNLGNRTGQTQHNLTGPTDTTTTYTYNGNGAGQPHTLTSTTGSITGATSYRYDTAGNMTTRNAGNGNQTLTWNDAGQLTSVARTAGTSNSLYDAAGNLLLQKDPGTTTLYLPTGQQHTLNSTTQTVTGVRYYPLPGGGTAIRTGAGTNYTFVISNPQGTPTLYLNNTAQTPTWRQYTPYGDPRGAVASYPDNHGFLNKPLNASTGLTRLGAREYDPTTGKFISIDPVMNIADPQQWNAYSYANNSPVTLSDPSGLSPEDAQWGGGKPSHQSELNTQHRYGGSGCGAECKADQSEGNKRYACKGVSINNCHAFTDSERKAIERADDMLKKWGDEPKTCFGGEPFCGRYTSGNAGARKDQIGPHERAWCRMVGAVTCKIAQRAFHLAENELAVRPKGVSGEDPRWNAKHHGLWMAIMVANGVPEDDARLFGVAHEVDHWEKKRGVIEMRRDLRNNDVGIEIGRDSVHITKQDVVNAWASNGGYSSGDRILNEGLDSSRTDQAIEGVQRALSTNCAGICFS